jgi:hypothetical protein
MVVSPFFSSLQLLMPVYPGQMRYIRKNLFHAVYVFDPASACGAEASFLLTFFQYVFVFLHLL